MSTPRISIIISTCNRAAHLKPTLESLTQIEVPAALLAELLLVDNGSRDDTPRVFEATRDALLQNNIQAIYLQEPQPGVCRARNKALQQARGEVLFVTDDDVRAPHDWLHTMSTPLFSGEADAVAGGVRLAPHLVRDWMTPMQRGWMASTEDDKIKNPHGEPGRIISANMAIARRVLEKVSGFDEELGPGRLGFCDDILFSLQLKSAGFKIAPMWNIEAEHHFDVSRLTRASLLERARKEGRSTAYLWYHWMHMPVPRPRFKKLYFAWKLALWRLRNRPEYSPESEGCSETEMRLESKVACFEQYLIEMRRPRLYDKQGLVKRG